MYVVGRDCGAARFGNAGPPAKSFSETRDRRSAAIGRAPGHPPSRAGAVSGGTLLAALLLLAIPGDAARAQDAGRERLIGVVTTRAPAPAPAAAEAATAAAHAADVLYSDAQDDLARGHRAAGQRMLELLIARHPASAAADRARRDLARLYAAPGAQAISVAPRSTLGASDIAAPAPAHPVSAPAIPAAARPPAEAQAWRTEVRAARTLQDDLGSISGDRVFFSEGSADLGLSARTVLAEQARLLKRYPRVQLVIEGHADDGGLGSVEAELSRRRAEAVRQRLVELGIAPSRIGVRALAGSDRAAICGEPQCAAQNRRAVTVIDGAEPGGSRAAVSTEQKTAAGPALAR